ncbi:MAG: photosystem II protein Y [Brasilonema octagenarum HA4186-MV1]|jgi:photosystem II PsbY protein|uniref:Photosystem II reaction center protein Y n=2 Tax=Brasilonema TaxID=383614 RepID=A0A856MHX5_9CYAN|nr:MULTISPECIES: photosystem II protein Y [Brasilonema]MBW4628081.1 photosystem II protein Y [Brasilonema octagenarum HA4186-MV1]NMF67381.1 photosystem II protein Y [Brasilonema octagenarum UFV-OR1]QDL08576.1 photosystem II protein Y [Brasilonema sennae CENA114]QDL14932.1 photosystem II protein Y [Brasilonema octagenarum UFV-E1]
MSLPDMRLIIVLAPLLIAAGWAFFNIGAAALNQLQNFLNREEA